MQEYVDAENANCQGQDGGYFTVQFTLNACTPTPPVANGYRGIYGGCTYHGHATPTPAYCLINPPGCVPNDADYGVPSPIKICWDPNANTNDGSVFTWPPGECECPAGTESFNGRCLVVKTQILKNNCENCNLADPIYPGTGTEREEEVDYEGTGPFPLRFSRTYNSNGQFGPGWKTNYDRSIFYQAVNGVVNAVLNRPEASYSFLQSGSWVADADVEYQLSGSNGSFSVVTPDGREVEKYDGANHLSSVWTASNGAAKYSLTYSTTSTPLNIAPVAGLLIQVADPFGHSLNLTYDSSSRLSTMTDPNGGLYSYAYDGNNNLISVTYPDLKVRQYVYNEAAYNGGVSQLHALTGIIDENSSRFANFGYNATGLAVLTERAGGVDHVAVTYATLPTFTDTPVTNPNGTTYLLRTYVPGTGVSVVDGLGATRTYGFTTAVGMVRATGSNIPCFGLCTPVPQSQGFDVNGNVTSKVDFKGDLTCSTYDTSQYYGLTRNVEISRTEGLTGSACPGTATARTRTISTTWDYTFPRLPSTISVYAGATATGTALRVTAFTYDADGNTHIKTITDPATGTSRTWTYTYDSYGRMLTAKAPRTDVNSTTTYLYYTCTTGVQCGMVNTVTDALGHITTYNTYNSYGQPLTITDPNNVVTTLTSIPADA